MGLAFQQIKTYAKIFVLFAIALAVSLVVVMNIGNTAKVWFFGTYEQINVLWLMLTSGATAVVLVWVLRRVHMVVRDLRDLRHKKDVEAKLAEQRKLAEEVRQREERIDAKLKTSLEQPGNPKEA
jgi:type VI protein secretion system component VasK